MFSKKLAFFVSIIVFTSARMFSNLIIRNLYVALFSAYPINTTSKVLRPSFHFLGSRKSTLAKHPYTFRYAILGAQTEMIASPHKFKGVLELTNIAFIMSFRVLFFLSTTPLNLGE